MRFIRFLTSRGFAIFLLSVSIGFLALRSKGIYSPLFLAVPAFLFLSLSLCIARRVISCPNRSDTGFRGSITFHIGMLVLIAAVSAGALMRFGAIAVLPQGENVSLSGEDLVRIESTPLVGEIPFILLRLDWQKTEYEGGWSPVDHAAGLSVGLMGRGDFAMERHIVRVNAPLVKDGYQFVITAGKSAPRFVLEDKEGEVIFNRFVDLPTETGFEGSFDVPDAGLTVHTRFFPDMYTKGSGAYGTRSMEPKNPAFGIRIAAKEDPFRDAWRGVIKIGEKAAFRGMTLKFADLKPVVVVMVTKDFSYWWLMAGWVVIVAGLVLRYLPVFKDSGINRGGPS